MTTRSSALLAFLQTRWALFIEWLRDLEPLGLLMAALGLVIAGVGLVLTCVALVKQRKELEQQRLTREADLFGLTSSRLEAARQQELLASEILPHEARPAQGLPQLRGIGGIDEQGVGEKRLHREAFPQAIHNAFPAAQVQACIVHLMRHALSLCSYKDRRPMARHMTEIYRAPGAEAAADRLDEFEERWGAKYGAVVASWREHWEEIIPMFAFAPEIRRLMYTTNAIESMNRGLRKSLKTRGHFPISVKLFTMTLWRWRNVRRPRCKRTGKFLCRFCLPTGGHWRQRLAH